MEQHNMAIAEPQRATVNLWPEAGRILGLGRNSVYQAAGRGEIPTVRIGKRLLVPKVALNRLLEARA
jgi:excisionase family DNA binding protein